MKYTLKKSKYRFRFDFDIGYLVKSPCRECSHKGELPNCAEECIMLDEIHFLLSDTISCSKAGR